MKHWYPTTTIQCPNPQDDLKNLILLPKTDKFTKVYYSTLFLLNVLHNV